jgi:dynein heavy chain
VYPPAGAAKAYPELDEVAGQLAGMQAELKQLADLAAVFEFPQLVEPAARAVKDVLESLAAARDVWDCAQLCERQFAVRASSPPPSTCRAARLGA